jgi:PAS domain S-box-containing protein
MGIKKDNGLLPTAVELRGRAEGRSTTKGVELHPPQTKEATQRLFNELEVQQIELEMQNEELRRIQHEFEVSRNKYTELYDFAPVGYFTFDTRGLIREVNLTGAHLLGIERRLLADIPFINFIADADGREIFTRHLETVLQRQGMQRCEIILARKDGSMIHGQLQSVAVDDIESKEGHVLSSIVDGTAARQLGAEIQDAREYAENIVETVRKPLVVLDFDLKILTANNSFYDIFKVTPEETIGNFIYDLGNRQWDIPKLRVLFEDILPNDSVFNGYEVDHDFPGIGRKIILLNARQIFRKNIGSHIILLAMEDITARKQAEEALLQAGALQSAIFNSANFSSIATDAKGVIQIFNVGAERMLGYTAAEVMNKITPADISDPQEVIARAEELSLELGTPITPGFEALVFKASRGIEDIYELTYIRKDGSRFPAVVSVTALRDDQDAIIGYLLIGTDNTARKQAEDALLKAGALQSAIFNSANFSSIATDAKGVIQIFNVGAERMLGYTAAEVMNKITPADISDPQEVIARAEELSLELGTPITPGFEALVFKASRGIEDIYELTYIRKDGSRFPAVVSVTALRDDQDAIIGYLLIGTDNTARKQIEAEQKQLSQRLRDHQFYTRSLFESNIDAIMTTDPSGIITDVNKQMEVLTGCTRDELIGAPFKNYFTDPDRAELSIKQVLREKKVTNYELTARARDGNETVVSFNATTFYDRDRKLQGVFAAARDVTERKRLDQVLQEKNVELESARSVAEKANLSKSEFLSSMSHELRSPLNAILGFAQLMESGSPLPTPTQKASIDQILKGGWYLLELINEILDLALIESGRLSLSLEPMSLVDVMLECQAMIEPQAQKSGIRMNFSQLESPYFVYADRTRVKQVLINLFSNAIKYNRAQGKVEVTCSAGAPGHIRISVQDTGEGLPPEKLAQLFQPFNRLGQEASVEEGTGIGLVVSKQLVELMGGEIGVESTVGTGSLFWVELNVAAEPQPFVAAAEPLASIKAHVQQGTASRTLLYIEDNPANMQLIKQLIERRPDLRLLSAGDGTQGIALASIHQPEVILMDINLPGINGIQVLKLLREDPATAHIPVLAISANAMPHDIKKGLEVGFFRYLTKPINVNEFMDALDMALEFVEKKSDKNT